MRGLLAHSHLEAEPVVAKRAMGSAVVALRQIGRGGPAQLDVAQEAEFQQAGKRSLLDAALGPEMISAVLEFEHAVLRDVRRIGHRGPVGIGGDRVGVAASLLAHPLRLGWDASEQA